MQGHEQDVFSSSFSLEEETRKLAIMRAIIQKNDSKFQEVEDATLRRFLHARDLDVWKASSMFIEFSKWRREFVPNGFISESEIGNQIAQGKVFLQGKDKHGCPISVLFGAKHFPCKGDAFDEFKKLVVYALDKASSRRILEGQEKFTVIVDLKGFAYRNGDARGYISILSILQNYYPERLRKCFIIHAPYIFLVIWRLVCPFIDQSTRRKIFFVEEKCIKATLLEEIDEDQLPQCCGGKMELVSIQEA